MRLPVKSKLFDQLSDQEFFYFCQEQELIRIERDHDNTILISPTNYPDISGLFVNIACQLNEWNQNEQYGIVFESSAGFYLPIKAMRSSDCSFITHQHWNEAQRTRTTGFP